MTRVEWTRQSGDDVEAVVGMLLCNQYPNAVRVRPSQGDGGIDIFVPGSEGFGKERAVYQVKRYCENLTSSQKRKIKRSFNRVVEASKAEGWKITEWHLVMPLDLTDKNLLWLDEITDEAEFDCETNGLLFCDTLAAHDPKVIDYYLRDGKDRLQAELNNLTAVLSGRKNRQENDPVVVDDVLPDLVAIYKALNACDPFYKYDYAVSDAPPTADASPEVQGLVAVFAMKRDSVWVTVRIIALSLAALEERPISGTFKLAIPDDDDDLRQQVQKFVDYGAPLSMPEGTISGSLDLPGGLDSDLTGASLQVIAVPKEDEGDEPVQLIVAMLASDSDSVLGSTLITRTTFSAGQAGVRSVWKDDAGLFTLEMLANEAGLQGDMNIGVGYDLTGRRPRDLVNSLGFLAAMHNPNRIAFGSTYGPPNFAIAATAPGEPEMTARKWADVCGDLAHIQDHVTVLLKMPAQMTHNEAVDIRETARLLSGEVISGGLSGAFNVTHTEPQLDRELDRIYEFMVVNPIKFTLGGEEIEVGKEALLFRGRFVEITDEKSRIEPISDGLSMRYIGEVGVGRVLARNLPNSMTAEPAAPDIDNALAAEGPVDQMASGGVEAAVDEDSDSPSDDIPAD